MGKSLPIWVRTPAEYEPEADHIICRWEGMEWAMPIAVAQKVSARLNRALNNWRENRGTVVPMRRP